MDKCIIQDYVPSSPTSAPIDAITKGHDQEDRPTTMPMIDQYHSGGSRPMNIPQPRVEDKEAAFPETKKKRTTSIAHSLGGARDLRQGSPSPSQW